MRSTVLVLALLAGCASAGSKTGPVPGTGGEESGSGGSGGHPATGGSGTGGAASGGSGGTPAPADAGMTGSPDAAPNAPPAPGACAKLFGEAPPSEWVHYDPSGKLVYKAVNEQGDRIMDFSFAGYLRDVRLY